jgi:hypothetical protein
MSRADGANSQPASAANASALSASSGPAAPAGGLHPVPPDATDEAFWAAANAAGGAEFPRDLRSNCSQAPAGTPFNKLPLAQAMALCPRDEALGLLAQWLVRTNGGGNPTQLQLHLDGLTNKDDLRVVCLRVGAFAPNQRRNTDGKARFPGGHADVMRRNIVLAVEQFAAQHSASGAASAQPSRRLGRVVATPSPAASDDERMHTSDTADDSSDAPATPQREPLPRAAKSGVVALPLPADVRRALDSLPGARSPARPPRKARASPAAERARTPPRARDAPRKGAKKGKKARRRPRTPSPSSSSSSPSSSSSDSSDESASSDSSSSSSDSDSGSDSPHRHAASSHRARRARKPRSSARRRFDDEMESIGMSTSIATSVLENILRGRRDATVEDVLTRRTFEKERNRHEVLLLARVIDCLRDRRYDAALELLLRRLSGVQLADRKGNWEIANALLAHTEGSADLPERELRRALKTAAGMTALAQGSASASSSSAYGRATGRPSTGTSRPDRRPDARPRHSGGGGAARGSSASSSHKGGNKSGASSQPRGTERT